MSYRAILPDDFAWITRPHDDGEPARHVAELSARRHAADARQHLAKRAATATTT